MRGRIVVIGQAQGTGRERLRDALSGAEGTDDVVFVTKPRAVRARLDEDGGAPRCIFMDLESKSAQSFVAWLRGEYRFFAVPVIAMVPTPEEASYQRALAAGADDVVAVTEVKALSDLATEVRTRFADAPARPAVVRTLIVSPSADRRRLLGRTFRLAGFDPTFAEDVQDAADRLAVDRQVRLAVLATEPDEKDPGGLVEFLRDAAGAPDLRMVVLTPSTERIRDERLRADQGVAQVSIDAPVDDLLFSANEILSPIGESVRKSPRILYGALVSYRAEEEMVLSHGFSYNISGGGLYVRTMNAPEMGSVIHVALRPPFSRDSVHLRGKVVWVRRFNDAKGGAAPAGFGLEFIEGDEENEDLKTFRKAYGR
ncbi:MAG: PilZ domain-containing protein, partial [Myxococcales bacterium]|nr:PilZ domain-containing protein [Myxococcales bacterium]